MGCMFYSLPSVLIMSSSAKSIKVNFMPEADKADIIMYQSPWRKPDSW